jgi:hypothetical protein
MNKMYFANLTGKLFTKDLNLCHLLEILRQFIQKYIIKEFVRNKRNLFYTFNDSNLIWDKEMEDIKQGIHTLSDSDIGNLLEKIYLFITS